MWQKSSGLGLRAGELSVPGPAAARSTSIVREPLNTTPGTTAMKLAGLGLTRRTVAARGTLPDRTTRALGERVRAVLFSGFRRFANRVGQHGTLSH